MPERQQRHQRARERRVVGRLGPGDALDRALAPLAVRRELLLGRVGQERRHLGAARRQRPEREPDPRAAQPRLPRAPPVAAAQPAPARLRRAPARPAARAQLGRHVQRLADREQPDGHDHDVDPVAELVDAERQPRLARQLVDPDEPDQQPDRQRREAADQRRRRQRRHRRERQQRQREVVLGAELHRQADATGSATSVSSDDPDRPGHERADRRRRQRGSPAPAFGHLEALDRGRHRRRLARRVQQDRRRRAAVHAARVDAGEQDERADRVVEVERDRQQQRDRQRRPDPRQHADQRPQRHAERRQQQVLGREHGAEAVEQVGGEDEHQTPQGPVGSCTLSHCENANDVTTPMHDADQHVARRLLGAEQPGREPEEDRRRQRVAERAQQQRVADQQAEQQRGRRPVRALGRLRDVVGELRRPASAGTPRRARSAATAETAGASRGPLADQPSPTPSVATSATTPSASRTPPNRARADHFARPRSATICCTRFCSDATKSSSSAPVFTNGVQS